MRRVCGFLLVLLFAVPLAAQAPAPARTVKLADHLYEITTFAANPIGVKVLALVGAGGGLLVDSTTAETAPAVRTALDTLAAGPVRMIVNTHVHDDHVGGNHALGKDAVVFAHDAVGRRLTTRSRSSPSTSRRTRSRGTPTTASARRT
jgi:cyclase